jgi:hypothetical protein
MMAGRFGIRGFGGLARDSVRLLRHPFGRHGLRLLVMMNGQVMSEGDDSSMA